MTDRRRIEELERRVRELEARPLMPTIVIQPVVQPLMPAAPFYPTWPGVIIDQPNPMPFEPGKPVWYVDYNSLPRC